VQDDALRVPNAALRYAPPQISEDDEGRGGSGLIGMIMPRRNAGPVLTRGTSVGQSVWVLQNGVPTEIAVTPGDTDGKLTAITAEGLKAGDLVIVDQTTGR
jgi:HlyD family secretion protein